MNLLGEMMGLGGDLVALQSFSTIQKGTGSFSFQSNELFSKFLRLQIAISNFYQMYFGKIQGLGGIHPSSALES